MKRSALLVFATAVAALSSTAALASAASPLAEPPTITSSSNAPAAAPPATPSLSPPSSPEIAASAVPLEEAEAPPLKGGEPAIKRTVIEDRAARIEELRVRGTLQKVTVIPKGGAPRYEVLTGDGFHATADDPGTSRGSAGKRVWNVLRF